MKEEVENKFEWPGWSLKNNPHGKDFDIDARKRMVYGSEILLPFIYKYKNKLGDFILEVGPFFNPLTSIKNFPEKNICYWENDLYVLHWLLKYNKFDPKIKSIYCNLNEIEGDSFMELKHETYNYFNDLNNTSKLFNSVMISQVLNYVDYKLFLIILKNFIKKDSILFINNVIDYGLPKFFSSKRPKNNKEIINTIKEIEYEVIEHEIIKSPFPKSQPNDRLILVIKNK